MDLNGSKWMDLNGSKWIKMDLNGSKWILATLRSCCEVGIKDFFDLVFPEECSLKKKGRK